MVKYKKPTKKAAWWLLVMMTVFLVMTAVTTAIPSGPLYYALLGVDLVIGTIIAYMFE